MALQATGQESRPTAAAAAAADPDTARRQFALGGGGTGCPKTTGVGSSPTARRDWQIFTRYLGARRPPLQPLRCSPAHVLEFLRYLDRFGKTRVHAPPCAAYGAGLPFSAEACQCPRRQAWGSLDALVAAFAPRSPSTMAPVGAGLRSSLAAPATVLTPSQRVTSRCTCATSTMRSPERAASPTTGRRRNRTSSRTALIDQVDWEGKTLVIGWPRSESYGWSEAAYAGQSKGACTASVTMLKATLGRSPFWFLRIMIRRVGNEVQCELCEAV